MDSFFSYYFYWATRTRTISCDLKLKGCVRACVIKGVVVTWCKFSAKTWRIWIGEVKKHSKYSLLGGNRKKWRYENIRLEYAKSLRCSSDGIKNEKGLKIERKYSLLTYLSSLYANFYYNTTIWNSTFKKGLSLANGVRLGINRGGYMRNKPNCIVAYP